MIRAISVAVAWGLGSAAANVVLAPSAAYAVALEEQVEFDIGAQKLDKALLEFSKQAGVQVLTATEVVSEIDAPAVKGRMKPGVAMGKLLEGTELRFHAVGENAIAIEGKRKVAEGEGRRLRLAQAEGMESESAAAPESVQGVRLDEIVVTAQKRSERLQDVPVPVTSIDAASLLERNQLRLQDFYATVPALNLTTGVRGEPVLAIRGIATGYATNPTVGVVVDDVPYGASTGLGGGFISPDIDPSDISRIEVLRGPQGTLYGASSMGGLLKFVTVDPATDRFSGRLQAGVSGVKNGSELGYNLRGTANVPLGEVLALRVSGFTRRDPGYIDDPGNDTEGVNQTDADGGRLSALWRPSDRLSIRLSALRQDSKRFGSSAVYLQPDLRDLEQAALLGTGVYRGRSELYSATVTADLGGATLAVLTGYNDTSWTSRTDNTAALGSLADAFLSVSGASIAEDTETRKFTQEIRLSGAADARVNWLIGGFYTDEKTRWLQQILGIDPATGVSAGSLIDFNLGPTKYEEYAAFGNVTFQVTERIDVQVGGRESTNRQTHLESSTGLLAGDDSRISAKSSAFTYLFTPRIKLSADTMAYARFASGYRPGGPNQLTSLTSFPPRFGPDKSQNYELGVKGDLRDHALSFDASLYYIDWRDLQLVVTDPTSGFQYTANTSRAKSQGLEVSLEYRPMPGVTIAGWAAWNKAVLTEPIPPGPAYGVRGDRLPYSSPFSSNLSLDRELTFPNGLIGVVGVSASYVDDRSGTFTSNAQTARSVFPNYVQVDLRAGARLDSWVLNVFLNNIADRRGVLTNDPNIPSAVYYIQPRTVGVSVARNF